MRLRRMDSCNYIFTFDQLIAFYSTFSFQSSTYISFLSERITALFIFDNAFPFCVLSRSFCVMHFEREKQKHTFSL